MNIVQRCIDWSLLKLEFSFSSFKNYYLLDKYEDSFLKKKDIIDLKHCRRGGLPNATESCNEENCPGNLIFVFGIILSYYDAYYLPENMTKLVRIEKRIIL